MINYQQRKYWNSILLAFAIMIAVGSLIYTRILVKNLSVEERKIMDILANTYEEMNNLTDNAESGDISFLFSIIKSNENIPLILTDSNNQILESRNLDSVKVLKKAYLEKQLKIMKWQHPPITIHFAKNNKQYIYYKDSWILTQLKIYPFIQLFFVILFIIIAYFAFNSSRKFEQNKVWVGMSKETAHQLGTPVSSLMALSENIKESGNKIDKNTVSELEKDIKRLEIITERFSKIGSIPRFEKRNLFEFCSESLNYLRPRITKKVSIEFNKSCEKNIEALIIPSLLDWVIENICKNAINAMEGSGKIEVMIKSSGNNVVLDITDTGKGIPRTKHKTIFNPGYTTNTRGWGMGLSLTKRIIEDYHKGEIYVKWSELGKGTTFRIKLKM
jgi:two-component system, sporulation sensor kinase E